MSVQMDETFASALRELLVEQVEDSSGQARQSFRVSRRWAVRAGAVLALIVGGGGPSLSMSGETLRIEESMTLRARTESAGHVGVEHEWGWSRGSG